MRILCVVDKRGRIQWQRTHALLPYLSEHDVDVKALNEKFDTRKYDTVYYSHFSLFDKAPCNCRRVASITSHKCLENMKRTLKVIKHFDAISVNNTMLFDIFRSRVKSLHYTPNGVNTKLFSFREKELSDPPVFGWVGNADREIKNFKTIVKPLMKKIKVHAIATSKKDDAKRLRTQEQMAKYYGMIDWFLVTSSAEGTSNPFLESHASGVPAITTRVGNTIEIMEDGFGGFFADDNLRSFQKAIDKTKLISNDEYINMRHEARKRIESWDWQHKAPAWCEFILNG